MSDFLSNIVARNNNQLETVQPRLPSLFEPSVERNLSISEDFEQDAGINYLPGENQESPRRRRNPVTEYQLEAEYPSSFSQQKTEMVREPQRRIDREKTDYIFSRDKDEFLGIPDSEFSSQSQTPSPANPTVETQTTFVTNNYLQTVELRNQKLPEPTKIQQIISKETFTKEIFTPKESTAVIPEIPPLIPQQPATKLEQVILPMSEKEVSGNTEKFLIPKEIPQTQTLVTPAQITPISVVRLQPIPQKVEATTINVTIGRIEVRATTSTTVSPSSKPKEKPPVMSLEEYLSQRGGGK
jgi:hypothetical protein